MLPYRLPQSRSIDKALFPLAAMDPPPQPPSETMGSPQEPTSISPLCVCSKFQNESASKRILQSTTRMQIPPSSRVIMSCWHFLSACISHVYVSRVSGRKNTREMDLHITGSTIGHKSRSLFVAGKHLESGTRDESSFLRRLVISRRAVATSSVLVSSPRVFHNPTTILLILLPCQET